MLNTIVIVDAICRYESIAKGQLVSPSLAQHVVTPKQVDSLFFLSVHENPFTLLLQIFADLHVCLHEVAPVMEVRTAAQALFF